MNDFGGLSGGAMVNILRGEKGCASKHIDDAVLYQAFVNVFNALVEQKDYFIAKWREADGNELVRYRRSSLLKYWRMLRRLMGLM